MALKKPMGPHDPNVGGAPMSSAVPVKVAQLVGRPYTKRVPLLPESEREASVDGSVAWLNPQQQHPVHSLPPGFGVQFTGTGPAQKSMAVKAKLTVAPS